MSKKDRIETLKQILKKYDWQIDICQDVDISDSEVLLKVISEFNKIYPA